MHKQYYELTVNGDYSAEGKRSTGLTWLNEVQLEFLLEEEKYSSLTAQSWR